MPAAPTSTSAAAAQVAAAPPQRGGRPARPRLRPTGAPAAPPRVTGPPVMRLAPGAARVTAPIQVEALVNTPQPGSPLPESVLRPLESTFDRDLSDVRVHTDAESATVVDSLQVRAFTYGTHIYLGRGEQPADLALMAHEITHVVQQSGAPVFQLYAPAAADRFEREAEHAAGVSQAGGRVAVKERTGGPRVQGRIPIISDVVDFVEDRLWDLLERVAPSLVPIFRQGVLNWLKDRLSDAVEAIVNVVAAPVRAIGNVVDSVRSHFSNLVGWMRDAAGRIARGDCTAISEAADKIYQVFEGLASPVIERVKNFFGEVKKFFSGLVDRFIMPVWDLLKRIGGAIWETIERIGRWIWEKTQPVRDWLARAWRWLKNFIGIGEGEEGQNGILQWFQRKAQAAWDWVTERLAPFKRHLLVIAGVLVMLSPAGPLIAIGAATAGILRGIQWLRQHMRSRNAVVQQQSFLRGTILPAILNAVDAVSGAVRRVANTIVGALGRAVAGLTELGNIVGNIPIIGFARGLVDWIASAFRGLLTWAMEGIQGLADLIQGGLERLGGFARTLVDALEEILRVVGNFFRIAGGLFRRLWNAIPRCIRDPFVDWFIPLILRNIPFFSELASSPEAWQQTKSQVTTLLVQVFVNFDLIGAMKTAFRLVVRVLRLPLELLGQLLDKASQAWDLVLAKPLQFIENAIKAILRGIGRFMRNILSHLMFGVQGWLLNNIGDRSITLPSGLTDWRGWLNLVLSILGLSVDHFIDLIDRRFPGMGRRLRQALNFLTGALDWLRIALTEGPRGLWRQLMQTLANLGNVVIEAAVKWVMTRIIAIISARLAALAASAGLSSVLEAVFAVWNAIRTAIEYATRIIQILIRVFDAVIQIANGVIDPAAESLETAFRNAMPVVIGFLANYAGLSGIGTRVREVIEDVRGRIDNAILALIDSAASLIRGIIDSLRAGVQAVAEWWRARKEFVAEDGHPHALFFDGAGPNARLMLSSDAKSYSEFISRVVVPPGNTKVQNAKAAAIPIAQQIDALKRASSTSGIQPPQILGLLNQLAVHTRVLASESPTDPPSVIEYGPLTPEGGATWMKASVLSRNRARGSAPQDVPRIMQMARRRPGPSPQAPMYIQGHLLNDNLGGPGRAYNLTPITGVAFGGAENANRRHLDSVERFIKPIVDAGNVIWYYVKVLYGRHQERTFQAATRRTIATITARAGTPAALPSDPADLTLAQLKLAIMNYEQDNLARALITEWHYRKYEGGKWVDDPSRQSQPVVAIANILPDGDFTPTP